MNPWRSHPALAGLPVPEDRLPPSQSWWRAQILGLTYPDGAGTLAAQVAANPRFREWAEGLTPPLAKVRRGPVRSPGNATDAVYLWLTEQATLRVEAIKAHVRRGRPTGAEIAFEFSVKPRTVALWVRHALQLVGGKRRIGALAVPQPVRFYPRELDVRPGTLYFGSGTQQSPGEVEGMARLAEQQGGLGVGVEVNACTQDCLLALEGVAGRGVPLFVDSGAFPEFMCLARGRSPEQCEIGPEEWRRRLGVYEQLARLFRSDANLVAPDKIGDQGQTQERLEAHGALLKKPARSHGAWILLVAQGGEQARHVFWDRMRKLLVKKGVPKARIAAALPMKARATTLSEVGEFVRRTRDLKRIHLLGMGPGRVDNALEVIEEHGEGIEVTYDSNLIRSGVGRGAQFLSVAPEVYTYAQDIVRYEVMHEAFQRSYRGGETLENWVPLQGWLEESVPDYTDNVGDLDEWLPNQYRRVLAEWLIEQARQGGSPFGATAYKLLASSPTAWLNAPIDPGDLKGPRWGEDPGIQAWLDDQWARFLGAYYSARVKRDAMVMAWDRRDSRAMRMVAPETEQAIECVMFSGAALFPGLREVL